METFTATSLDLQALYHGHEQSQRKGFLPSRLCAESWVQPGTGMGMGGRAMGLVCNWLSLRWDFPCPWAVLQSGPGLTPLSLETTEEGPHLPTKSPRGSTYISYPRPTPSPGCEVLSSQGSCKLRVGATWRFFFPRGQVLLPEAQPTLRFCGVPQETLHLPQSRRLPPPSLQRGTHLATRGSSPSAE